MARSTSSNGEDPFLAEEMVVPYIQEMQKNGVEPA